MERQYSTSKNQGLKVNIRKGKDTEKGFNIGKMGIGKEEIIRTESNMERS